MSVSLDPAHKAASAAPAPRPAGEASAAQPGPFAQQLQAQMLPADMGASEPPPPAAAAPAAGPVPASASASASASAPTEACRPAEEKPAPPSSHSAVHRPSGARAEEKAERRRAAPERAAGAARPESKDDCATAVDADHSAKPRARDSRTDDAAAGDVLAGAHWLQQLGHAHAAHDTVASSHDKRTAGAVERAGAGRKGSDETGGAAGGRAEAVDVRGAAQKGHAIDTGAQGDHPVAEPDRQAPQEGLQLTSPDATAVPAANAAAAAVAGALQPQALPPSAQVTLSMPVTHPEFRDTLAAQVSTFARDGVQEAVLNLHPADMGPITVQIAMDGTQARIDFQAALPATRELIEGSLPSLASALHGEGLTLAGGSVGDQRGSAGQQPPPHGGSGQPSGQRRDEPAPAAAAPVRAARGGTAAVDAYA